MPLADVREADVRAQSLLYIVLVSALGGFLFGFDSAVISGCEQAIQAEFGLDAFRHGFTVSVALIGTVIGAFAVGRPADAIGRKRTLMAMAVLYLVSAAGCAFAPGWLTLVASRLLGGLAIGGSSVVVPLYIVEVSPGPVRGRLVATNQLNIVLGILVSYVSNYYVALAIDEQTSVWRWCADLASLWAGSPMAAASLKWRLMLGVAGLPSLLFLGLLFTIPESPRWLVRAGRRADALLVLRRIRDAAPERTLGEIEGSLAGASSGQGVRLFQRRYAKPILLAWAVAMFNQLSGINAVNYYAPRIFEMLGVGTRSALGAAVLVGTVNLTFTVLAFFLIDRIGRRMLLIIGAIGTTAMHFLVAWQLSLGANAQPAIAVAGVLGFIACFAVSQGAVVWVFISEVFPNAVRAKGQALGCFTHWFMCTVISWVFPMVAEASGSYAFGFFGCMTLLQLVFALKLMPETRGGTIEDVERRLGIALPGESAA
jgi:SP family xylose:H+ symportor-like MFS transporter